MHGIVSSELASRARKGIFSSATDSSVKERSKAPLISSEHLLKNLKIVFT
jgi:hypothetical protein